MYCCLLLQIYLLLMTAFVLQGHTSPILPRSLTQPRVSSDIPVHPEPVLPLARGAAGNAVRSGHRHVVSGLYPGGDAHRRASVQRR